MKVDYRKKYRDLYNPPSKQAVTVTVPPMLFLMIDGAGDPNGPDFQRALNALYGLTYTIKFWTKKHKAPPGYFDYSVPPLEALWWVKGADGKMWADVPRDRWCWRAMVMQPGFVTPELLKEVSAEVAAKKPNPKLAEVRLETFDEGLSVQVMHIGPYSEELPSIEKIENYMKDNRLVSNGRHHELYLGDPRRSAPEKLRTILRHPVKPAA